MVVAGYRACSAVLRHHGLVKTPERALTAAGHPDWRDRPVAAAAVRQPADAQPAGAHAAARLVSRSFTARRVAGLRPAVERITADLLDRVAGDVDAVAAFAFPLPVTVIGELLGIPPADRPMFQSPGPRLDHGAGVPSPLAVDTADALPCRSATTSGHWPPSGARPPPTT